jgi:hypothetical protein
MLYSTSLVSPVSTTVSPTFPLGFNVTFGANYTNQPTGDIRTPGVVNEIGSVQTNVASALGDGLFTQFEIVFRANSAGLAQFVGDPAEISPLHDTLTFLPVSPVPFSKIKYGFDTLLITAPSGGGSGEGFTNAWNRFDVNNDGFVTAIDALGLINSLNSQGPRPLGGAGGEGEDKKWFPDVNADGYLTAVDVLSIINELSRRSAGGGSTSGGQGASGEGEAEGEGSVELLATPSIASPAASLVTSLATTVSDTTSVVLSQSAVKKGPVVATATSAAVSLEDYLAASSLVEDGEGDEDWLGDLATDVAQQWKL